MSTNNEKAKAEFMTTCLKDHDQETCERMWNDAVAETPTGDIKYTPRSKDYAALARENEDLKINLARKDAHLKQALEMLANTNARAKAEKDALRFKTIEDIYFDSKGAFTKEQLTTKSDEELKGVRDGLNAAKKDDPYASVSADADAQLRRKPTLTVGEWNPEKKQWKGGI